MRIQKIIHRHRREFTAIYECEHCSHSYEGLGCDNDFFHRSVIPNLECDSCGKKAKEDHPMGTKYEAFEVV